MQFVCGSAANDYFLLAIAEADLVRNQSLYLPLPDLLALVTS